MILRDKMLQELEEKVIFDQARNYAFEYIDGVEEMDVFPSSASLDNLRYFH